VKITSAQMNQSVASFQFNINAVQSTVTCFRCKQTALVAAQWKRKDLNLQTQFEYTRQYCIVAVWQLQPIRTDGATMCLVWIYLDM